MDLINGAEVMNSSINKSFEGLPNPIGWEKALLMTLLSGSALFTIFGSLLVILSVWKNKHLRTITNSFVVSLAVADLLVGVLVMPLGMVYYVAYDEVWMLGRWTCVFWRAIDVLACTSSILNLCCISLERYGTIVHRPLNRRVMERRGAAKLIAAAWILSFFVSFPCILVVENSGPRCNFTNNANYLVVSACVSFYIPAIIMLSVYCKIFKVAREREELLKYGAMRLKVKKAISENNLASRTEEFGSLRIHVGNRPMGNISTSKEHKATRMIAKVIGTFLLFWFPYFTVANILLPFCRESCLKHHVVLPLVTWLGWSNSLFNPIIYACNSAVFKNSFKDILLCKKKLPLCSPPTFRKYPTSQQ